MVAKRIIEQRRSKGKGQKLNGKTRPHSMSTEGLLKAFQDDVDRKRILIRRAETARARLTFVTEAIRKLVRGSDFRCHLAEEGLTTIPEGLASRLANQLGATK